ncbi:hypothetical protein BS78_04G117200 [Paspalum vaginatum]|nr:hypothetical protein BS78_04G117200 [Paspalum vaginatum]
MERGTGARGTRSPQATTLTLLDDVMCDILVLLPDKAILRCSAVCRKWRDLISSAVFLRTYEERQPSLPLGVFYNELSSCSRHVVDAAVDAFDLRGSPAKRQPVLRFNDYNLRRQFSVHASCDGLILLSLSNGLYYLCNPATRQWITLPSLSSSYVVGLYPRGSSGEYRILHRRWTTQGDINNNSAYYVLTVGSSAEPRCLGTAESLFAKPSMAYISSNPPVLLHDCLHWDEKEPNDGLIVFDTDAESFRCMRAPTPDSNLVEVDGLLGISHVNKIDMAVEIRVLQDYKKEVWSLKYKINLPMAEMRCISQKCQFDAIVVSMNGDVLVQCNTIRHLFHCDSNGKLLQRWDGVLPLVIGFWFRKSLFKHTFFRRQKGGRVKQQPRFFRGL